MPVQQIDCLGGLRVRCYGTLQKVGEEKTALLEVSEDLFLGLCGRGDGKSGEKIAGEAAERALRSIEEFGVSIWSRSSEQEGLNMDGTKTRGPFEAQQAASNVLGRGELAAAIARQ